MRTVDRWLRTWRTAKALPFVQDGARLLDIGCHDGSLLNSVSCRVSEAVGVDPLAGPFQEGNVQIVRGSIPEQRLFEDERFDCITMLATLEHVDDKCLLSRECCRMLSARGRLVITVPAASVDRILRVLSMLRVIDGMMSLDEHHGFDVGQTERIFQEAGFRVVVNRTFQLGLNHLFVFEKRASA